MKINENLRNQYQWAKDSLIGKKFRSLYTGNIYYPSHITIDENTRELRVCYTNGITTDELDTPLVNFMNKFQQYEQ